MQDEVYIASEMFRLHPFSYHWTTYLWVLGMAISGGMVRHIRRQKYRPYRNGSVWRFVFHLCKEVLISGFVGIITFYVCELKHMPQLATAVILGIAGHMGSSLILILEGFVIRFMKNQLNAAAGFIKSEADNNDFIGGNSDEN